MAALNPARYDYREVACPQCHAAAGSYCCRPSGHSGPFVAPHRPRRAAAHSIWRAEELEKYGRQITTWDDDEQAGPDPRKGPVDAAGEAPAEGQQLSLFGTSNPALGQAA